MLEGFHFCFYYLFLPLFHDLVVRQQWLLPHLLYAFSLIMFNILMQYSNFVKPAFDDFILPTKKYADIIIPRGGDNHIAVDLIVQHIRTKLGQHDLCKIYPNLYVIHSTFQVPFLNIFIQAPIFVLCIFFSFGSPISFMV